MKKLKYTNPYSLKENEFEIEDFHYTLAEIIQKGLDGLQPSEIMIGDGVLYIGVCDPPLPRKKTKEVVVYKKYKITIEKI